MMLSGKSDLRGAGGAGAHGSRTRRLGWLLVGIFSCVLLVELAQEAGLLQISPDVEYWSAHGFH